MQRRTGLQKTAAALRSIEREGADNDFARTSQSSRYAVYIRISICLFCKKVEQTPRDHAWRNSLSGNESHLPVGWADRCLFRYMSANMKKRPCCVLKIWGVEDLSVQYKIIFFFELTRSRTRRNLLSQVKTVLIRIACKNLTSLASLSNNLQISWLSR